MKTRISERVNSVTNIPAASLSEKPPLPRSVKIEVTGACDLKCSFCAVSYKKRVRGQIDETFYNRLIREIRDANVQEVGLFWMGESFLNKELPSLIASAKEVGIPFVFVTTNGRLLTREKLQRAFDSGLDSLKFSINANNAETFHEITGVDGFDEVVENLRIAHEVRGKNAKPGLYASTAYDPKKDEEYQSIHARIAPFVDEHYKIRLYGPEGERSLEEMLPCWPMFTLPHISWDGFMSACFCDFDPKLFMADLNKMSFAEAWHSEALQELRRSHLKGIVAGTPCETCIAYKSLATNKRGGEGAV